MVGKRKIPDKELEFALELYFENNVMLQDVVDITGLNYSAIYPYIRARQDGLKSSMEWRNQQAKKWGYESHHEYEKAIRELRKKYPENKELSDKIKSFLDTTGKSIRWLARKTRISRQRISTYRQGTHYPRQEAKTRSKDKINSNNKRGIIKRIKLNNNCIVVIIGRFINSYLLCKIEGI